MLVKISNARLAFPALFAPKTVNGEGEPKFSASFLMDPLHPGLKAVNAVIETVAQEKWGAKATATLKPLRASDKVCLHSGESKADYAGYEGNFYLSASNKSRPLVIDRDKTPLVEADGRPYAGCYVNASVDIWAQDNNFGKRVNATLRGVQFLKDGDAFTGGGAAKSDEFDDLGVEEEELA